MTTKRKGIWGQVDELRAQGQTPSIVLEAASKIVGGSGRTRGRPRLREKDRRPKMATPAGHRMYCQQPGCHNQIKKSVEAIVCSDRCHAELLRRSSMIVGILTGQLSAREYPGYYRSKPKRKT